ncbi:MAG: hypothetical protein WDO70_10065 [Alphaproteobacteria bacterium]
MAVHGRADPRRRLAHETRWENSMAQKLAKTKKIVEPRDPIAKAITLTAKMVLKRVPAPTLSSAASMLRRSSGPDGKPTEKAVNRALLAIWRQVGKLELSAAEKRKIRAELDPANSGKRPTSKLKRASKIQLER